MVNAAQVGAASDGDCASCGRGTVAVSRAGAIVCEDDETTVPAGPMTACNDAQVSWPGLSPLTFTAARSPQQQPLPFAAV